MSKVFKTRRRVEFCETDAAGIAHFSSFLCYMEQAEHEFLRSLGHSVVNPLPGGGHLSWPRVNVECQFVSPVRFEQLVEITLQIARLGSKSVTYQFTFEKEDGSLSARGQIVAVCCLVREHGASIQSTEIPDEIRTDLAEYLAATKDV